VNIFEFLGLPKDHRKHPFQLVKKYSEVSEKLKKPPYILQTKYDGLFAAVACINEFATFGRSGKMLSNTNDIERTISKCSNDFNGFLITEIYHPTAGLEEANGILNPNRTKPLTDSQLDMKNGLKYIIHDYLSLDEFIAGVSAKPYLSRYTRALEIVNHKEMIDWSIVYKEEEIQDAFNKAVKAGEEGIILKRNVDYQSGHKGWRSMKLVRNIDFDLLCTGYEMGDYGTKRYGMVTKLIFKWKDETIKADLGKGYTDENRVYLGENPSLMVGHLFHVYAMKMSTNGKLRQPKVGERRIDKDTPDA